MDSLNYKEIGKRVRKARLEKYMSQEALAEHCDISTSFLGHIERGTRKMSLETLTRLASVLDISISYLLTEDDSPSSEHTILILLSESSRRLPPEQYKRLENAIKALIASADLL